MTFWMALFQFWMCCTQKLDDGMLISIVSMQFSSIALQSVPSLPYLMGVQVGMTRRHSWLSSDGRSMWSSETSWTSSTVNQVQAFGANMAGIAFAFSMTRNIMPLVFGGQ